MAHADDGDLRHRLALGLVGDLVEELALAVGHEFGGAGALGLELGEPLADILHALVELVLRDIADLEALGDRRLVQLETLLRLLGALHLLDGALHDLVALRLERLHLVEDRLVLLVVRRGVELAAKLLDAGGRGALLDLEAVHARLQLLELGLQFGLLLGKQGKLLLLCAEVSFCRGDARAECADLAIDPVKCQEVVEKRHVREGFYHGTPHDSCAFLRCASFPSRQRAFPSARLPVSSSGRTAAASRPRDP